MVPKLLLIPLITVTLTQALKFVWDAAEGKLSWRAINFYGGMPSAHTSIVVSLCTVIGLHEGVASPTFAVAVVFSLIVIRDAIGFRRYLGGHSHALNVMVRTLPKKEQGRFRHFRERLGHTPLEAFVGGVVGFSLSVIFYQLIP